MLADSVNSEPENLMPESRKKEPRTQLLVSVRSVEEAESALAGGADVIDIKDPTRGSLGKANDSVIADVLRHIGTRKPASVAMGELQENENPQAHGMQSVGNPTLNKFSPTYLKWGLAQCQSDNWQERLHQKQTHWGKSNVVSVAYADWQKAESPPIQEVIAFACQSPGSVFLIDTFEKAPLKNLLSWLTREDLSKICRHCRTEGVQIALAGSLGIEEIDDLIDLQPDWFAVRGAVCSGGRASTISQQKVRRIADRIHSFAPVANLEN